MLRWSVRRALPIVAVVTVGLALVAAHAWLHPPARDLVADGAPLGLAVGKLAAMLQALATLAAIDLAALAIGTPLWRRLRPAPQPLVASLPPRLALGLLVLANAVLALAALHLLIEPALAALVAVPIAVAAPAALRALRARPASSRPRRRSIAWIALAAVAAVVAAGPLLDAFVPRYGWDALTYHLSVPERYLWGHKIWFTRFSLYSAFPLDVEMLYALGMGLGSAAVAKLVNLQFGVLALWTLALLGRRASPRAALFAVAIVLADPLFAWELGVAYTDLAGGLYALLAFDALVDAAPALDGRALARLAIFGGACVAIRLPALLVPAALTLTLAVAAHGRGARALGRAVAVVAAGVAVEMAPWLLRTAAFTGNPLAPAWQPRSAPYFDPKVVAQMLALSRSIGIGHGLSAIVSLPWRLFVASRPGVYSGGFGFDVGPLYLGALVAALVAALTIAELRRDPRFRAALATAGLIAAGWFYTSQEARYLVPALLLVALAGALALDALAARADRGAVRALVWALPVAAVAVTQAPRLASLPARLAVALGPLSPDEYEEAEAAPRLAARLRQSLPPDARVLLVLESRSFYFRGLDFIPYHPLEGSPVLDLVHDAADARALRCELAALGVTHVVVNLEQTRRFHPVPIAGYGAAEYTADLGRLRRFLDEWAEPMAREGGVVAARLRPIDGCTGVNAPGTTVPKARRDSTVSH